MSTSTPKPHQRVLVCGGRDYRNKDKVFEWLDSLHLVPLHDLIIEGGCRYIDNVGADFFANLYGEIRHIQTLTVWAPWHDEGRAAGPIRNRHMLQWGPTRVLAFPGGAGTANMKWLARGHGIPVIEVPE